MPGASTANDFSMKTFTPFLHRVFEVDGPESRRRGQQHQVAFVQGINRLLEAVEADELALGRNVELLFMPLPQVREAALEAILEDIRHRPELGGTLSGHGLGHGAGATSAAADESKLDGVVLGGVARAGDGAGQGCAGESGAGGFQEFTAGSVAWVRGGCMRVHRRWESAFAKFERFIAVEPIIPFRVILGKAVPR